MIQEPPGSFQVARVTNGIHSAELLWVPTVDRTNTIRSGVDVSWSSYIGVAYNEVLHRSRTSRTFLEGT